MERQKDTNQGKPVILTIAYSGSGPISMAGSHPRDEDQQSEEALRYSHQS